MLPGDEELPEEDLLDSDEEEGEPEEVTPAEFRSPFNPVKKPATNRSKYRTGLRVMNVTLDHEKKRLLNVLHRETDKLLMYSKKGKLNRDHSTALVAYLRLVKDMEQLDRKNEAELTDEELAEMAAKESK